MSIQQIGISFLECANIHDNQNQNHNHNQNNDHKHNHSEGFYTFDTKKYNTFSNVVFVILLLITLYILKHSGVATRASFGTHASPCACMAAQARPEQRADVHVYLVAACVLLRW